MNMSKIIFKIFKLISKMIKQKTRMDKKIINYINKKMHFTAMKILIKVYFREKR